MTPKTTINHSYAIFFFSVLPSFLCSKIIFC